MRLQHENRLLKEKKDGGQDEAEVLQTVNAGLLERISRLEAENRCTCRVSQSRKSLVESQVKPLVASGSLVASIKAKLASKPVFAGSLLSKTATISSDSQPLILHGSSSCSQLSSYSRPTTSGSSSAGESGPVEAKVGRIERLKDAFLSNSGTSFAPAAPLLGAHSSRVFSRSTSYGYDRALGFATAVTTGGAATLSSPAISNSSLCSSILHPDRKWDSSESEAQRLETSSHLPADRNKSSNSLLRLASSIADRRESDPTLSRMETVEVNGNCIQTPTYHKPPPPPVEAVVITRDSSPRDETDSGYRGGDSLHYDESSPGYSPDGSHFDEGLLLDYHPLNYKKEDAARSATSGGLLRTPPNDSIEIDVSFNDGQASFDSESVSVSSFSIMSGTLASSDRSFDRSQSLLLTPRSSSNRNPDDDTSSRKSFGKSLKKRKMFKAAANAMFSICGP